MAPHHPTFIPPPKKKLNFVQGTAIGLKLAFIQTWLQLFFWIFFLQKSYFRFRLSWCFYQFSLRIYFVYGGLGFRRLYVYVCFLCDGNLNLSRITRIRAYHLIEENMIVSDIIFFINARQIGFFKINSKGFFSPQGSICVGGTRRKNQSEI